VAPLEFKIPPDRDTKYVDGRCRPAGRSLGQRGREKTRSLFAKLVLGYQTRSFRANFGGDDDDNDVVFARGNGHTGGGTFFYERTAILVFKTNVPRTAITRTTVRKRRFVREYGRREQITLKSNRRRYRASIQARITPTRYERGYISSRCVRACVL